MRLCELQNTEILAEHILNEGITLQICLVEGTLQTSIKNTAGHIIKGVGNFYKTYPGMSGMVMGYALDALHKYKSNKRNTVTFYSKGYEEKKFYEDMIKQLTSSGFYKVIRNRYVNGGHMWQLRRTRRI